MTKKNPITTLGDAELTKLVTETREKLRMERFAAAGARPKESNAPRKLRVTIARILTEQTARSRKTA